MHANLRIETNNSTQVLTLPVIYNGHKRKCRVINSIVCTASPTYGPQMTKYIDISIGYIAIDDLGWHQC